MDCGAPTETPATDLRTVEFRSQHGGPDVTHMLWSGHHDIISTKQVFFFPCNVSFQNFKSNLQQKGFVYCQLTMHKLTCSTQAGDVAGSSDQDLPV